MPDAGQQFRELADLHRTSQEAYADLERSLRRCMTDDMNPYLWAKLRVSLISMCEGAQSRAGNVAVVFDKLAEASEAADERHYPRGDYSAEV